MKNIEKVCNLPNGLTITLVLSAVSLHAKYLLEKVCNSEHQVAFTESLFTAYLAGDSHNLTLCYYFCVQIHKKFILNVIVAILYSQ